MSLIPSRFLYLGVVVHLGAQGCAPPPKGDCLIAHRGPVYCIVHCGEQNLLISAGEDGIIRARHKDGTVREIGRHTKPVTALAYLRKQKVLASAGWESHISIWDLEKRVQIRRIPVENGPIETLCFDPISDLLISAGADELVRVWETNHFKEMPSIAAVETGPCRATLSTDGMWLAVADSFGTVRVWNWQNKSLVTTIRAPVGAAHALTFLPGKPFLAVGGLTDRVVIQNVMKAEEQTTLQGHRGKVLCLAFSSDGKMLASCGKTAGGVNRGEVVIWRLSTGETVARLSNKHYCTSCIFSADSSVLFSGTYDGMVKATLLSSIR